MKALKTFNINFVGLKEGKHQFDFHLDKNFLENFEDSLVEDMNVDAVLILDKHNNLLELHFSWKGTIASVCDICNEGFDMPIEGKENIVVKFVHDMPDNLDELEVIYLQQGESSINIAVPIYEAVMLQIPIRKVHPEDEIGNMTCDPEVLKYLEDNKGDLNATDSVDDDEKGSIWDELKKIK